MAFSINIIVVYGLDRNDFLRFSVKPVGDTHSELVCGKAAKRFLPIIGQIFQERSKNISRRMVRMTNRTR